MLKVKNLILSLVAISGISYANDASTLFDAKCSICHAKSRPADMSNLVAPPIMGVMRHVKMTYNTKDSAVNFIMDYVINPSKDKAVCMPQKIAKFGLMPSQKGIVTKEELSQIASWLYDNYPPQGFRGQGMGKGKGMGQGKGRGQGRGMGQGQGMGQGF